MRLCGLESYDAPFLKIRSVDHCNGCEEEPSLTVIMDPDQMSPMFEVGRDADSGAPPAKGKVARQQGTHVHQGHIMFLAYSCASVAHFVSSDAMPTPTCAASMGACCQKRCV